MVFSLQANEPLCVGEEMCGNGGVWESSSEGDGRHIGAVRFRPQMGLRLACYDISVFSPGRDRGSVSVLQCSYHSGGASIGIYGASTWLIKSWI